MVLHPSSVTSSYARGAHTSSSHRTLVTNHQTPVTSARRSCSIQWLYHSASVAISHYLNGHPLRIRSTLVSFHGYSYTVCRHSKPFHTTSLGIHYTFVAWLWVFILASHAQSGAIRKHFKLPRLASTAHPYCSSGLSIRSLSSLGAISYHLARYPLRIRSMVLHVHSYPYTVCHQSRPFHSTPIGNHHIFLAWLLVFITIHTLSVNIWSVFVMVQWLVVDWWSLVSHGWVSVDDWWTVHTRSSVVCGRSVVIGVLSVAIYTRSVAIRRYFVAMLWPLAGCLWEVCG